MVLYVRGASSCLPFVSKPQATWEPSSLVYLESVCDPRAMQVASIGRARTVSPRRANNPKCHGRVKQFATSARRSARIACPNWPRARPELVAYFSNQSPYRPVSTTLGGSLTRLLVCTPPFGSSLGSLSNNEQAPAIWQVYEIKLGTVLFASFSVQTLSAMSSGSNFRSVQATMDQEPVKTHSLNTWRPRSEVPHIAIYQKASTASRSGCARTDKLRCSHYEFKSDLCCPRRN